MWKKIVDKNLIVIDPPVTNKKELFEGMVNHVYQYDYILNEKKFLDALQKREDMANTELIPGIALPHARSSATEKLFLSIILLKKGIDYDNPDLGPVKIIFFFGCNDTSNKEYLQILAKSNRLLKTAGFHSRLLACNTVDDVLELLHEYDDDISSDEHNHYLMIVTLNDPERNSDVMNALVELGITNASIVEADSMAKTLAYEIPVFAGLSYMAQGKSKRSSLIMAHVEAKDTASRLADLLKENGIDLSLPGNGFIQTIKVEDVIGNFEEEIDL